MFRRCGIDSRLKMAFPFALVAVVFHCGEFGGYWMGLGQALGFRVCLYRTRGEGGIETEG